MSCQEVVLRTRTAGNVLGKVDDLSVDAENFGPREFASNALGDLGCYIVESKVGNYLIIKG